eukprot:CAMPEP_0182885708 /NCGR_PEP_ID=MMETSP0034_2-20130328/19772_1 /TAXON_ID=156128 /ORGANISM="Nephroselmis pyriformis, Strain CCMP717" /LENGTH=211 /DNA_ID=CAMNT_0025018987 /DNA_START=132 /DNA_END=767 /DNA_ORIENTATION=+
MSYVDRRAKARSKACVRMNTTWACSRSSWWRSTSTCSPVEAAATRYSGPRAANTNTSPPANTCRTWSPLSSTVEMIAWMTAMNPAKRSSSPWSEYTGLPALLRMKKCFSRPRHAGLVSSSLTGAGAARRVASPPPPGGVPSSAGGRGGGGELADGTSVGAAGAVAAGGASSLPVGAPAAPSSLSLSLSGRATASAAWPPPAAPAHSSLAAP